MRLTVTNNLKQQQSSGYFKLGSYFQTLTCSALDIKLEAKDSPLAFYKTALPLINLL